MPIDLTLLPTTYDAVHVGLAAVVLLLLILQVALISVGMVAFLRRRKAKEPLAVVIERVPAELASTPSSTPTRVAIEKVPSEMIPAVAPLPVREAAIPAAASKAAPPPLTVREAAPDAAVQLLGLLQKEARFLDFVQENIANYADGEIGAAARVVHEGCRKVLRQHFELEPVRKEQENTRITLPKGFDASVVRVTGNIVGEPPFTGTLVHRGWRVAKVKLPKLTEGHDVHTVAQAEVEL